MITRDRHGREKIWRATTAHIWAHVDDGLAFFADYPIARLADAEPVRAVSLRETAQPTGAPTLKAEAESPAVAFYARNLWLAYPNETWVVTLLPASDVVRQFNASGDHPAAELLMPLAIDVDRDAFLPPAQRWTRQRGRP